MHLRLALLALAVACVNTSEPVPFEPAHSVTLNGDVQLTFRAELAGGEVQVFADLLSVGADSGRMDYGSCSFAVRGQGAYATWDNARPPNAGCTEIGLTLAVGPGELQSERIYRANTTILRQQVTGGPYDITVIIRLNGKLESFFAGKVTL